MFVKLTHQRGDAFWINPIAVAFIRPLGANACHIHFGPALMQRFEMPAEEVIQQLESGMMKRPGEDGETEEPIVGIEDPAARLADLGEDGEEDEGAGERVAAPEPKPAKATKAPKPPEPAPQPPVGA